MRVLWSVIAWFSSRWVVRRMEAPIASLTEQCEAIQAGGAPRTLRAEAGSDELLPLVLALNELLSHLDRTITQQHRFIADAAHELRTPLTA